MLFRSPYTMVVLLKGPGVLLNEPGVLLKEPGVLLKDPGGLVVCTEFFGAGCYEAVLGAVCGAAETPKIQGFSS